VAQDDEEERDGARVHFRIPEGTRLRILEVGEALGFQSVGTAARHLMYLGLESALVRLSSVRSSMATERMAATFSAEGLIEAGIRAGLEADSSSILDTTGTTRHRTAGQNRAR
jgi:hypothetical protein